MKSKLPRTLFAFWVLLALAIMPAVSSAETSEPKPDSPAAAPAAVEPTAAAEQPAVPDETKPAATGDTAAPMPAEVAKEATDAAKPAPEEPEPKMRELGAEEPSQPAIKIPKRKNKPWEKGNWAYHSPNGSVKNYFDDTHIAKDKVVKGDALAVLGDTKVDGEVKHDAVALVGDVTINGIVRRNAVAVLGDVTLGPKARVEGDVVCVGGEVHRDPGAFVGGEVRIEEIDEEVAAMRSWWSHAGKLGRPLAVAAHLGWLWIVTGFSVAFYALLALIFPRAIRNCGDNLVLYPGQTILATVLGILALPVLFVLLCITIIGIPVALLLLPMLIFLAVLFGKASLYALTGRLISGDRLHSALATILGALIFVLLYMVPVAGMLLSLLVAVIGFGCVILSIASPGKKAQPPPLSAAAVVSEPSAGPTVGTTPPGAEAPAPALPPGPSVSPLIPAATLPRAGFWIRVGATMLDLILIGMVTGMSEGLFGKWFHLGEAFPLWFAVYHVLMWKFKGTTIGGIICGLKVVRIDDRPLDWSIAIVRSLSAFLSLVPMGLGFMWVAFDDDRQSWHDKIAGTTIVKVPKGTSLL